MNVEIVDTDLDITEVYESKSAKSRRSASEKSKQKAKIISNLLMNGIKPMIISKMLKISPNHISSYIRLGKELGFVPANQQSYKHCQNVAWAKYVFLKKFGLSNRTIANAIGVTDWSIYNMLDNKSLVYEQDPTGIIVCLKSSIQEENLAVDDMLIIYACDDEMAYMTMTDYLDTRVQKLLKKSKIELFHKKIQIISAYPIVYFFYANKNQVSPLMYSG